MDKKKKTVLPNWYQVLLVFITGPFGFVYAFLRKDWSQKTKITFLLLWIFWPVGLYYMGTHSDWGEKQKKAIYARIKEKGGVSVY